VRTGQSLAGAARVQRGLHKPHRPRWQASKGWQLRFDICLT